MILQGTGVNPDPNRNSLLFACFHDSFDLFTLTDVSRIDPDFIDTVLDRHQGKLVVKMNIRHKRNMNAFLDFLNGRGTSSLFTVTRTI